MTEEGEIIAELGHNMRLIAVELLQRAIRAETELAGARQLLEQTQERLARLVELCEESGVV